MTEPEVEATDRILTRHGVQYVVVGGQAIGKSVTATIDVDVMVTTPQYAAAVTELRSEPDLEYRSEEDGVAFFSVPSFGGLLLDVLDAAPFAGDRNGEVFFDFLVEKESVERDGIRYAKPAAVWYTRLLVRRWKVYAEKVLRNVVGGMTPGKLRRVEEIARRFGTADVIRERIAYVRAELRRPDLEYILEEG